MICLPDRRKGSWLTLAHPRKVKAYALSMVRGHSPFKSSSFSTFPDIIPIISNNPPLSKVRRNNSVECEVHYLIDMIFCLTHQHNSDSLEIV